MSEIPQYDVMILGSGLGGAMLAAILAKSGLSVLILEAETHPRFTIGEATTPDTNFRLKLLGLKYDIPEIANLSTFHDLRDTVLSEPSASSIITRGRILTRLKHISIQRWRHQWARIATSSARIPTPT